MVYFLLIHMLPNVEVLNEMFRKVSYWYYFWGSKASQSFSQSL